MKKYSALLIVAITAACAQPKVAIPYSSGGSKADASVEMSYSDSDFQQITPDWNAAGVEAGARCKAWGYSKTEPFGGVKKVCNQRNSYGCIEATVTRTFQCLD